MNEDQYNCKHEWRANIIEGSVEDGTSKCHKCGLTLKNSNRLQLEMNRYNLGLQKRLQILTIIISLVALFVSVYSAIN